MTHEPLPRRPGETQHPTYYRHWLGRIDDNAWLRVTTSPATNKEISTATAGALERLGYATRSREHTYWLVLTQAGYDRLAELIGERPKQPRPTSGPHRPLKGDIAGVDLIGTRRDDGTIELGSGHVAPSFPDEVEVEGVVYRLEEVRENEAAVTPSERRICWGVYC